MSEFHLQYVANRFTPASIDYVFSALIFVSLEKSIRGRRFIASPEFNMIDEIPGPAAHVCDDGSQEGIVTNWVTSKDGSVAPSDVKLFPGNGDGIYEIEYSSDMVGLSIGTDFDSQYLVIQSVSLR